MKKYYSMEQNGNEASINIYGDIASNAWEDMGEFSSATLSKKLAELGEVSRINVYINSYGGEVAEGVAIYNALKRHKAKVFTYCDGFAASIASVIFMAGDERIMNEASALMIHNAWACGAGNAEQLRKQADDLDKLTELSITAYKAHSVLTREEITALMDAETWILPEEALEYGFATSIEKTDQKAVSQNAKMQLLNILKKHRQEAAEDEEEETEDEATEEEIEGKKGAESDENAEGEETPTDEEENPADGENEDESPEEEPPEEGKAEQKIKMLFNAILNM